MPASMRIAKLSPPRAASWLIRRRLHRTLDALTGRGVAWIAAEPGAGKSTLAATWTSTRPGRALWYRVDAGDADAGAAFIYFRELARTSRRKGTLPAYAPQHVERLDLFARTFFRSFFAVMPAGATLVIDDAHAAAGTSFDDLLAAAVREAPADVAVVVLSRNDPGGTLLEEVARGAIHIVPASALAFTAEEAVSLLAERVDRAKAHALRAQTNGWVAGMLLLAHARSTDSRIEATDREWLDAYFARSVLADLGEEERTVLAAASLLPEIDSDALHRMGFDAAASGVLERLHRVHAFVSRLDRQPPSWRMHDLLRDSLRARFERTRNAPWRARLRAAAAGDAASRGLARDAVQLHLENRDEEAALAVAESAARELVATHRTAELAAIAAALGEPRTAKSLVLQSALGDSGWQRKNARAAIAHYERAFNLIAEPAPTTTGLLIAASALGAILEGWQDFAGNETWLERLSANASARDAIADPNERLRIDSVRLRVADMLQNADAGDRAELTRRLLDPLRERSPALAADEALAAGGVLMEHASYSTSDERLFAETVEASASWLQRSDASPLARAGWLVAYGPIGRRWPTPGMRLPAKSPLDALESAIALAREHGGQGIAFSAALFLAYLAIADHDRAAAHERLEILREVADPEFARQTVNLLGVEASVLALDREWVRAASVADHAIALAEREAFPISDVWTLQVTRQRIAIGGGDTRGARTALLAMAALHPPGMKRDFTEVLADVASAAEWLRSEGAIPEALTRGILERASALAWPGFATLIAPLAAELCAAGLRLGIAPEFARQVIRERHLPAPRPYEPHWPCPVRIHALGGFRIEVGGEAVSSGPRGQKKTLDLLKAIVAHGPPPVDAAIVLDALWPDADGAAARSAFDVTALRLRKLLGHDAALRIEGGRIGLDRDTVWVDAFAFAHGAIDDYPGPLFGSDTVQPWWAAARERLHQRFLKRTAERGHALERAGALDAALAAYEAALVQDPLAEEMYRGAIRCHLAAGRASDALRAYRRCRDQLAIVLGVAPSRATTSLVAALSAG